MLVKLIQFIKMSWMLSWRLVLLSAVFFAGRGTDILVLSGIVAAAVCVFGFNRVPFTWPIFRLITRKRVIGRADGLDDPNNPQARRPQSGVRRPQGQRVSTGAPGRGNTYGGHVGTTTGPVLSSASRNGRITGFEPKTLEQWPVPQHFNMKGAPGAGLHGAQNMSQTNIDLGVKGEENFARALSVTHQLGRFNTIWSVPVPDADYFRPGKYETDIDCIIGTESAIFLVDLKNYKSGDVRYHRRGTDLYCEDVATGQQIGDVKTMTRNMEMATAAMRKHFPNANIVPVVVFMPTDKGEGTIDKVVWPGGIPAMNLSDFMGVLANQGNFDWKLPHAGALARMGNLLTMGASKI